jgi:SMI1-KNR4 cell-wall
MEIEDKNFYGTLSLTELGDFEEANEIQLPSDYKDFLLDSNGGQPVPNRILKPMNNVTYILGMHNGPYYASLYKHIDMFKGRLPLSSFPIATDPFGNLFIMSTCSRKESILADLTQLRWSLPLILLKRTKNIGFSFYSKRYPK